nr:polyprenol monophosphomannose synthase [uncultured Methanolobus sp.]
MLSVVIPTYNEALNIQELVECIYVTLDKHKIECEVLVVDDNSPDGTGNIVNSMINKYPSLKLISRLKKEGLGVAHLAGYNEAKGDIIVTMDADMSHHPKELPVMYRKISEGYDMVIGSRYIDGGAVENKRLFNVIASKIAGVIARVGYGANIKDFTNGYRMFKRDVFEDVRNLKYSNGNVFLAEFVYYAHKEGYKITEIPILFSERTKGETKTSVFRESKALFKSVVNRRLNR